VNIELACCEEVIENELANGAKQKDIALTYAMAMCSSWPTDWGRVNRAILAKWPKGLKRVKEMAWKLVEEKRQSQTAEQVKCN
jgi:hypothetical protein